MSAPRSNRPVPPTAAGRKRYGGLARLTGDPLGLLGLVCVTLVVVCGIFAPLLAPYDPLQISIPDQLSGPSPAHWLGTDQLGRDLLSRVIAGGRAALTVAAAVVVVSLSFGTLLGLLAGFGSRWLDNILLLIFDALNSFPTIILGLAVVAVFGPGQWVVVAVIAATQIPPYARIVRTSTLSLRNAEFILAERSLGAGPFRIVFRHILPNVIGPLIVLVSMDIPTVVALEAGLSFLGMGVSPPAPSWGRILFEGYTYITQTPWIVIAGGIPLVLTTLGFTFMGEALRDLFDPKLRRWT